MRLSSTAVACALFGLLGLVACSSDEASPDPAPCQGEACAPAPCGPDERLDAETAGCTPLGWRDCPDGFALDAAGFGCTDVLPAATCGARTMPVLGATTCTPVAASACAAGFERDPSGWGCRAIMANKCTGATMEALGQTACVPVGDCNAAFPPAGATYFVDAAFTAGQIDATHFKTIGAALAAAPADAIVAVQAGSYTEALEPPRSVHIAGRCPAMVTVSSPAGNIEGVRAKGAFDITIEGITLKGHLAGIVAGAGATLTVRSVVIDANTAGGVLASGSTTHAKIERSVVRGSVASALAKGYGVEASSGADVVIEQSAVTDNTQIGVHVTGKGTRGHIDRSVVARTTTNASKDFGNGLIVRDAASADVVSSAFSQNREDGVVSYGPGTTLTMRDSTVEDTKNSGVGYGRGVLVDGATTTLERVTISDSTEGGIVAEAKGTATLTDCVVQRTTPSVRGENGIGISIIEASSVTMKGSALVANTYAGATAVGAGAKLVIDGSLVADTLSDADSIHGYGVSLETGATGEVRGSALTGNGTAGAAVVDPGSKLTISASVIKDTRGDGSKKAGLGISVEAGGTAAITGSVFAANRDVGIAVRGAGSSATIDQSIVRNTLPVEANGVHGRGIEVGTGAKATIARTSILSTRGSAVISISEGSTVDVKNTWIADTTGEQGASRAGRAATVQSGATMTMLGVVAQRSEQAGVVVIGDGASLVAKSSRIEDVLPSLGDDFGHGIVGLLGGTVVLDDVTVRRCSAVALVFDGARGTVRACRVTDNAVGISVQGGARLEQVAIVPESPRDGVVSVSADTTFTGNATRVGAGMVPVPAPL
ncbi:MAG: hypothetical protein JWP87_1854 [Labilithrix sp.]|nr:hypothetical protein [Labilithrix sp.]